MAQIFFLFAVLLAYQTTLAANNCGNRSCSFENVNVSFCSGLQSLQANEIECKRKGQNVNCEARLADGTRFARQGLRPYTAFRRVCNFTGDGTGTGQCAPGDARRANADLMRGVYANFVTILREETEASRGCVAANVNQCDLFLARDPELSRFRTALLNDGKIDGNELTRMRSEWRQQHFSLSPASFNNMDSGNNLRYGGYYLTGGSGDRVDDNGTTTLRFRRTRLAPNGYSIVNDDSDILTYIFRPRPTETGRALVITDSRGSEVELQWFGDQCYPTKISGGGRETFSLQECRDANNTRDTERINACATNTIFQAFRTNNRESVATNNASTVDRGL